MAWARVEIPDLCAGCEYQRKLRSPEVRYWGWVCAYPGVSCAKGDINEDASTIKEPVKTDEGE